MWKVKKAGDLHIQYIFSYKLFFTDYLDILSKKKKKRKKDSDCNINMLKILNSIQDELWANAHLWYLRSLHI
jgi:hypothetical protein